MEILLGATGRTEGLKGRRKEADSCFSLLVRARLRFLVFGCLSFKYISVDVSGNTGVLPGHIHCIANEHSLSVFIRIIYLSVFTCTIYLSVFICTIYLSIILIFLYLSVLFNYLYNLFICIYVYYLITCTNYLSVFICTI
jgi:hypothetical protein